MAKKKVSEMPDVTDINRFLVFGVDGITNGNAKAPMNLLKGNSGASAYQLWIQQPGNAGKTYDEYVQYNRQPATDAAANANQAVQQMNIQAGLAISGANAAASDARAVISDAQTAASNATESANNATNAATIAKNAADSANIAAGKVNDAIEGVEAAITNATTATTNANEATENANNATSSANIAAESANNAATYAEEMNDHPLMIVDGIWHKWSISEQKYISTGIQAKGDPGAAFKPVSQFDTLEALKIAVPDGKDIDGMMAVGLSEPFNYYAWVEKDGSWDWRDQGQLQGAPGKSPRINELGFWEVYDNISGEWVNTNTQSEGKDGESWKVIDFDHIPNENDLTYRENGETKKFSIGDEVRYYDPGKGDFIFYKLYNITDDNNAEWKIAGTGSGGGGLAARSFELKLLKANWILNGGVYSYQVDNVFILDGTYISVIIQNNSVKVSQRAKILPQPITEVGRFFIQAKNLPDQDIDIKYSLIGNGTTEGAIQYEAAPDGGLEVINGNQFKIEDYVLTRINKKPEHKTAMIGINDWTLHQDLEIDGDVLPGDTYVCKIDDTNVTEGSVVQVTAHPFYQEVYDKLNIYGAGRGIIPEEGEGVQPGFQILAKNLQEDELLKIMYAIWG